MKVFIWVFSVVYVVVPVGVVWLAWTNQIREGLELGTKVLISVVLFALSFAGNWVAWSDFLRWKKRRRK